MEFLGVRLGQFYVIQINIYVDGNIEIGWEECFYLWFDFIVDFYNYSILWIYYYIV